MQERVERWLSYWVAKPIAWAIFWIWIGLKYSWFGIVWCTNKVREKWTVWRAKRTINGTTVEVPVKRTGKRQAA